MQDLKSIPLADSFCIVIDPAEKIYPKQLENEVDRLWAEALETKPWLFNGHFLHYLRYEKGQLDGQFVEYKYFYAGTVSKKLHAKLELCPVGIMGITQLEKAILMGKRSQTVAQFQGQFECIPAGTVDPHSIAGGKIDINQQYLRELAEEAGITSDQVTSIKPLQLLFDTKNRLVEIVAHIQVKSFVKNLLPTASCEHSDVFWLNENAWKEHYSRHAGEYIPLVSYLVSQNLMYLKRH